MKQLVTSPVKSREREELMAYLCVVCLYSYNRDQDPTPGNGVKHNGYAFLKQLCLLTIKMDPHTGETGGNARSGCWGNCSSSVNDKPPSCNTVISSVETLQSFGRWFEIRPQISLGFSLLLTFKPHRKVKRTQIDRVTLSQDPL